MTVLTRLFAAYPCRAPSDFRLVKPAYMQAMEGVCQWALFEAEKRINQGSLAHSFMPAPSELRREINRVMEPFRRAAAEARRYRWPEDSSPPPSRPPRQVPDYSHERIEISAALRRTLKAKESFAGGGIEDEEDGEPVASIEAGAITRPARKEQSND
ncbi:hypothetical protein [Sinorhizobium fredii]